MDNISEKITDILNNPDMMKQIKGIMDSLGNESPPSKEAPSPSIKEPQISSDMINSIMKLMPLISSLNQEDNNTKLLHALKPLLNERRKKRVDESIRIMQMIKLLPILKEEGIF